MPAAVGAKMTMTHHGVPSSIVQLGPLTKLGAAYLIDKGNKIAEKNLQLFAYDHFPSLD